MNYYEGDNIGGIAKIKIAMHTDFSSFNPAVLSPGKTWLDVAFKEQTANLQIGSEESENGLIYGYTGRFFLHRLRPELENTLNKFLGQHGIIEITDMNDEVYLIGAPGYPVTLKLEGDTGSNYPSENGASYRFSTEQPFKHFSA